jgi:hypothetical protein
LNGLWLEEVHLTGIANFFGATMGTLSTRGGYFKYSAEPDYYLAWQRAVLNLDYANIKGPVLLNEGFKAYGEVSLNESKIGGDLNCISGHFFNPATWLFPLLVPKSPGPSS